MSELTSPAMTIFPWDESRIRPREHGFTMPFVNTSNVSQGFSVHLTVIEPGHSSHAPHEHADEEVIFLMEGRARVQIGEDVNEIEANTVIYYPPNIPHSLSNCGDVPIRYFVVRGR